MTSERLYPMKMPEGHVTQSQRYISVGTPEETHLRILVLGLQSQTMGKEDITQELIKVVNTLTSVSNAPIHYDFAHYTDPSGYENTFAYCYWTDEVSYLAWRTTFDVWLKEQRQKAKGYGIWAETYAIAKDFRETIAFQGYLRGISACPHRELEPTEQSAYWGAARDRIPASAYDKLDMAEDAALKPASGRETHGQYLRVKNVPSKMCIIRSGVTWENCDTEQLESYNKNLKPKLDAGMAYLRDNPVESGCASLRQVSFLDDQGQPKKEAYSVGLFLSFKHLEDWAQFHPSHLAIYTRALSERNKFKENLQLRTYHEIYVLTGSRDFVYWNCHADTGLLPYFDVESAA